MPWHLVQNHADCPAGRPWAVVKDADGSVAGCHPSQAEAQQQLSALYVNEPQTAATGTTGCTCNTTTLTAVAAATALLTPPMADPFPTIEYAPSEWFDGPPRWVPAWRAAHSLPTGIDPATGENLAYRLTITDDGRVGGWFFEKGTCLVEGPGECWQPPPSATGYALFHQQDVVTDKGQLLRVGAIGNVGGHASPFVGPSTAQKHYADPSAQLIVCRAGDDEIGAWIAGALVPGVKWADVALLRRSALSGDWRPMDLRWFKAAGVAPSDPDGYDCVGPTLVTRPGLPLIKKFARAAALPVYLGGSGGVQLDQEVPAMIIQQADGTTIELTDAELGQAVSAYLETRTAAEAAPPDGASPDVAAQVADLTARVDAIQPVVEEIAAWMDTQMQSELAAIDQALIPLPE